MMSEIKKSVKTFLVEYRCDFCGEGVMERIGGFVSTYTGKEEIAHWCNKCSKMIFLNKSYPMHVIEEVTDCSSDCPTLKEARRDYSG